MLSRIRQVLWGVDAKELRLYRGDDNATLRLVQSAETAHDAQIKTVSMLSVRLEIEELESSISQSWFNYHMRKFRLSGITRTPPLLPSAHSRVHLR